MRRLSPIQTAVAVFTVAVAAATALAWSLGMEPILNLRYRVDGILRRQLEQQMAAAVQQSLSDEGPIPRRVQLVALARENGQLVAYAWEAEKQVEGGQEEGTGWVSARIVLVPGGVHVDRAVRNEVESEDRMPFWIAVLKTETRDQGSSEASQQIGLR